MDEPPRYNLENTLIVIDGVTHRSMGQPVPGRYLLINGQTGAAFRVLDEYGHLVLPDRDDLDDLIADGRATFHKARQLRGARAVAARANWDIADCEGMDDDARKRWETLRILDEHDVPCSVEPIRRALKEHWTPALVELCGEASNPHTAKRWHSERGGPGDRQMEQMVAMNGRGERSPYLDAVVHNVTEKHVVRALALTGSHKNRWDEYVTEIDDINEGEHKQFAKPSAPLEPVHYSTFCRKVRAAHQTSTDEVKHGAALVQSTARGGGKPIRASRFLEKVVIDHLELPAWAAVGDEDQLRVKTAWLTIAVDVFSRVVLGYVLTMRAPSFWTLMELMRRVAMPKKPPPVLAALYPDLRYICGKPSDVYYDNAPEHRGHSAEDAFRGVGTTVHLGPTGKAQTRGVVERPLGTIQRKIVDELKGRSYPIDYSRKAKHDGEPEACVRADELDGIANYAVAEYNTDAHEALDERPPLLSFMKSARKHGIDVFSDFQRLRVQLMEVIPSIQVKKDGARAFGLRYYSARNVPILLDGMMGKRPGRHDPTDEVTVETKAKYDPEDIYVLHVWNDAAQDYVELVCEDEEMEGVPLWFHEESRDLARAEGRAFATPVERSRVRARRLEAIRSVSPKGRIEDRNKVAKVEETVRNRRMTGSIVDLHFDFAEAVTPYEFIEHDLPAYTAFDRLVLSPRPPSGGRTRRNDRADQDRDRRDAGQALPEDAAAARHVRASNRRPRTSSFD